MIIIKHRKIFYSISVVLILISLSSIVFFGLKPSIDFTGGSLLDVSFNGEKPAETEINQTLINLGFGDSSIRTSGDGYIIRLKELSQDEKNTVMQSLAMGGKYSPVEKTFSSIGPILGNEAIHKSWISVTLVLLAIMLFVAFAFRKVSKPVSSWVYGLVTIFALLHDVIIPTGMVSLLGHFYGFEVDTLFVTAILVILGFSVHDTIVVFDRVRENLHKNEDRKNGKDFETIVGESINETFIRSINTSVTTLLAIFVLYLFGPASVKNFTLVLLVGIFVGTYSSIFIGSPLLVTINNWKNKK